MVRWNLAAVVGVPGVGKTSLSKLAAESGGYRHLNYGEIMLEIARKEGMASTEYEMFSLPLDQQYKIWRSAAHQINKHQIKGHERVLVDLHGVDPSYRGYLISIPLEILSPEIIVLVESSCENIIQRRLVDHQKYRPREDLAQIKEHIKILRVSMAVCSVFLGSFFAIVENNNFQSCLQDLKTILG
jgi:adenylate kinase